MRCRRSMSVVWAVVSLLVGGLCAQESSGAVKWALKVVPAEGVKVGSKFVAEVRADLGDGWHVYSITQPPGGPTTTTINVPAGQPFKLGGAVVAPAPDKEYDPNFDMEAEFYSNEVTFKLPLVVDATTKDGTQTLLVDAYFQACNDRNCLPPTTVHLKAAVKVVSSRDTPIALMAENVGSDASKTALPSSGSATSASSNATVEKEAAVTSSPSPTKPSRGQPLGSFILLAAGMGALSLLTPCVFPMIPITVSYFTNHASQSRAAAIRNALVYGLGIILTFTALGLALALVFGAGGVNQLAANPWVNLIITAIFVGFAFSLFGAYFVQVPPGLISKLNTVTGRQNTSEVLGTLLMGLTFTLTSFTCTAPFVGTLLVMASQGSWKFPVIGMLVFSSVFAVPFFVLALMPQLLSRLPKSGGWMNSVKVVMGFLEIAAAMKFLSNADLVWRWGIFTRQVVLAVWVGIGLLTVLYVLGYFRMAHDSPVESVGAARVTVAIIFLTTTIWLVPGLFGRQLGELESFLPPETGASISPPSTSPASSANPQGEAGWILNDYDGALASAKQQNKLVFVDFTGYTCTNCRWMEANMFPRPEIAKELNKFVRVRLYTDGHGELYEKQQKMQQERFGTVALPYYAVLRPDGSAVNVFPGLTRNADEFAAFLRGDQKGAE